MRARPERRKWLPLVLGSTLVCLLLVGANISATNYNPPSGYLPRGWVPQTVGSPYDDYIFYNGTPSGGCNLNICTSFITNDLAKPNPGHGMNVTVGTGGSTNYYWATSENAQSTWYGSLQFGFFTQNFTAGSAVGSSGTTLAGAWTLKGESVGAMKCWGTSTTGSVTFEILLGFSIYDWTTAAYLTPITPTSVYSQSVSACGGSWAGTVSVSLNTSVLTTDLKSATSTDSVTVTAWTFSETAMSTTTDVAVDACVNFMSTTSIVMNHLIGNTCSASTYGTSSGEKLSQIYVS
ncbi:MAG: hypothetical protein WB809_07045 [Thermoplasmata archaeon]